MRHLVYMLSILCSIHATAAASMDLDTAVMKSIGSSGSVHGQKILADLASGDRWRRFIFHEPQLSYSNVDSGNQESYGITLATPLPGKVLAYTEMDRISSEKERAEIQAKKQDAARAAAESYLDCASNRALFEIQKVALRDLVTQERSFNAMYESGHASQAERIGAELQARQTNSDVIETGSKVEVSCRKWRKVMDIRDESVTPDEIPDDLKPETLKELGGDPALAIRADAELKLARVNRDLRWWAQAPDLNWSYSRNHYLNIAGSPVGKEWTTTYGIAVNIPIFFLFNESVEADRARAQAMVDQRAAELDIAAAEADRETAAAEYVRGRRRLKELRSKDLALAEALVQSTLAAYKIGKLGFAELMMSRKTLADLRAQEVQLKSAVLIARLRCLSRCESGKVSSEENL